MNRRISADRESGRRHPAKREAAGLGLAAVFACATGCAAVLGIDEPIVIGGEGGSDAEGEADAHDAHTEAGRKMEAGPKTDAGPKMDASRDSQDSSEPGGNLIANGDFANTKASDDYWGIPSGPGTLTVAGGMGCVAAGPTNATTVLAWPQAPNPTGLVLSPSATYTFSYTASSTPPITVDAKIGQSTGNYTPIFESTSDAVGTGPTPFTHTFSAAGDAAVETADMSAGIAFEFVATSASTVCFEKVSLVRN